MSGRSMPFRSGDDAARAAVAPLLDELRGELLLLPRAEVVEQHLDLMAFEQRVLSTPRVERPARRATNRPRRAAFVFGCITATIASCGLSAAGALPEPLQQITDKIADTLGVPQPHDNGTSTGTAPTTEPEPELAPAPAPAPDPTAPAERPNTAPPSTDAAAKPEADEPVRRTPRATTTTEPTVVTPPTPAPPTEPADPPAFPPRPNEPGGRIDPKPTPEPPSDNSQNTPPGFPTDWRKQAIDVTTMQLFFCGFSDVLAPPGCPQSAIAPGAENVAWSLLGYPANTAAVVATPTTNAAGATSTLVTVYQRFRMVATYTLPETGTKRYLAYSSGIAESTMTWSGSGFANGTMKTGSVEGHVMPGVVVPNFSRPGIWDFMVAMKVQDEFDRCTASGSPDATCPPGGLLDSPSTNQSTLSGNIVSAAEVWFDGATGLYNVSGTYSLTPPSGAPVDGVYTATLFFDGAHLTILNIAGR
jgi:hypothetical protein